MAQRNISVIKMSSYMTCSGIKDSPYIQHSVVKLFSLCKYEAKFLKIAYPS